MSDTTISPFDSAIDVLRERERQYAAEMQSLTNRCEELRETIALLTSRKPRAPRVPRAPRAVTEVTEATEVADQSPPPSPFRFVPTLAPEPVEGVA